MAIVSIKTQQVTFYDADGWILRAPVSTGVKERETPAGVFAVIEKDKDHHSSMYDDAWMPNMQRITWNRRRTARRAAARICGLAWLHTHALWLCGEVVRQDPDRNARDHLAGRRGSGRDFPTRRCSRRTRKPIAATLRRVPKPLDARGGGGRRGGGDAKKAATTDSARDGIAHRSLRKQKSTRSERRRRMQVSPTRRWPPQKRTRPRRRPKTASRKPPPRPRNRRHSSTPPRPTRNRSSTPLRPQRTRPRQPRRGRSPSPRKRTRRSSRSNLSRSTSAARRRSFTCGATRTSRWPDGGESVQFKY